MRIAVDVRKAYGQCTGVGVYVRNLVREFRSSPGGHTVLACQDPGKFKLLSHPCFAELVWKQVALPLRLLFTRADLLFVPNPPVPLWSPCPVVVTIHDLAFCILDPAAKNSLQFKSYLYSARHAARIVTDSASSKRDIIRLLGVPHDKVAVIPIDSPSFLEAMARPAAEREIERAEGKRNRSFILAVPGSFSPHKGMSELLEGYLSLPAMLRRDYRLVIVGKKSDPGYETIRARIEREGAGDDVLVTGYVSDELLLAYYSAASLFVFPSKYEGFGLPPLEAMRCGVPVVTSNVSSLPEVTGEAAEYVDPNSPASIRDAIVKVLSDPKRRAEMIAAGQERVRLFSWKKACRQLESVFQAVHDDTRATSCCFRWGHGMNRLFSRGKAPSHLSPPPH